MTIEELIKQSKDNNITLTDEMVDQLKQYAVLLKEWNEKINLTTIVEPEDVYEKHFYDSILPLRDDIQGRVGDVGTGAGFPGLVWKIVRPSLQVTLIEPTAKRCHFLQEVINQLHLENIEVVNQRAEDFVKDNRESFDVITARAVANLSVLSELCVPLIKVNGYFVSLKGAQGKQEFEQAQTALKTLGITESEIVETELPNGDQRVNLYLKKGKATPKQYPRNYGQIKKKPL